MLAALIWFLCLRGSRRHRDTAGYELPPAPQAYKTATYAAAPVRGPESSSYRSGQELEGPQGYSAAEYQLQGQRTGGDGLPGRHEIGAEQRVYEAEGRPHRPPVEIMSRNVYSPLA